VCTEVADYKSVNPKIIRCERTVEDIKKSLIKSFSIPYDNSGREYVINNHNEQNSIDVYEELVYKGSWQEKYKDEYGNYSITDACSTLYDLNFVKVENGNCELILTVYKTPLELMESNKQITIGFNVFDENQVAIWNDSMDLPNDTYDVVSNWSKSFVEFNVNINYEILINGTIVETGKRISGEVELFRNFAVDDLLFLYGSSASLNVVAPLALSVVPSTLIPICPKDVISDTLSTTNNNISPFILSKEWELMVDSVTENGIKLELYSWPLVTDTFCKKLIEDAESYGNWTSGRHDYYPTHDILLTDIGYANLYDEILNEYAHPTARWIWSLEGSNWETMKVESFIVKYDNMSKDAQNYLSIHHDYADYTFVLGLNDNYEGGGTWFPRQKYLIDNPAGIVTLHPTITHRHGARPVTDGIRYALISFCRKT
jgi:hypothetical protein